MSAEKDRRGMRRTGSIETAELILVGTLRGEVLALAKTADDLAAHKLRRRICGLLLGL